MVIIQQDEEESGTGGLSIEQSMALDDGEAQPIHMSAAQLGEAGYTITTTDNGETYISSPDGQILTQVTIPKHNTHVNELQLVDSFYYKPHWAKKPVYQVTTMLATSKNVLFLGHNHLLTTDAD